MIAADPARAQDITGVWQGHFRSNASTGRLSAYDDRYKFEVQIAQREKSIEAVTYSYLSTLFYGKASATGTVNSKNGKVLLQEVKLLEVRNQTGDVCIMTCFLQYSKLGDDEFLEGNYVSMNTRDSSNCGRGFVTLHKTAVSDFYEEPLLSKRKKELEAIANNGKPVTAPPPAAKHTDKEITLIKPATKPPVNNPAGTKPPVGSNTRPPVASTTKPPVNKTVTAPRPPVEPQNNAPLARRSIPSASQPHRSADTIAGVGKNFPVITPPILQTRSNVLVRTIVVHSNEVTLNIYDDGAIDHDTISVYLDKRQVINHAMLTDRALVLTLHLNESDDYHELIMVADNQGEIPPNTSLMIVKAGDKEYEVRITSTDQKNAMVIFKYEKKP